MTTVKTAPDVRAPTTQKHRFPVVATVLALVVALLVGGASGWVIWGNDESPDVVVSGQTEPTDRQAEMADFVRDYANAWQEGDVDALVAMYTPDGTLTWLGTTYRIDDGSLVDLLWQGGYPSLDVQEPMLVDGNDAVQFHTLSGDTRVDILHFTGSGELLLISHEIVPVATS